MNRRKKALTLAAGLLLAASISGLSLAAPDAKSEAARLLAEVARSELATRVASEPVSKARAALRRAEQMRAVGDQARGAMLEELALEWATSARLLGEAAEREKQVAELQARTTELETKVFRAQTLVEQTIGRRARAEEALRKLEEKGAEPSPKATPKAGAPK